MLGTAPRTSHLQTLLYLAAYLVLWQFLDALSLHLTSAPGFRPWFPPAALDVLMLFVVGWRWWPLIPVAASLHAGYDLLAHPSSDASNAFALGLVVHGFAGLMYGLTVRFLLERVRILVPMRSMRDVLWFSGSLVIAAPILVGLVSVGAMVLIDHLSISGFFSRGLVEQYSRFVVGDATAIIAIVPAVLALRGWGRLRLPDEQRPDSSRAEIIALLLATIVLVVGGYAVADFTQTPLIDLSFVAIAWLALRYGIRGAVLGVVVAEITASLIAGLRPTSPDVLMQDQTFVGAAAFMALLIGSLTTERGELLAKIAQRAYVDDLTGLPNRERLVEWVDARADDLVTLVILDVDEMRLLNEGVGRVAADRTLQDIAIRLRVGLPTSCFVARVSADEFAVAMIDDRSPHAIMAELRLFFDAPFDVDGTRIFVSVSLGAVRARRVSSADELLRKADVAMHRAKLAPSRAVVYTEELQAGSMPSLVGELHRAVEERELVLFFQPIFRYDRTTSAWRLAGAEALLRWMHPERGIVSPVDFIDLLERLAICERVGWNVVETSLLQADRWRREIPDFRIWVNLFARQALDRECAMRIADLVQRTGVSADSLVIEISERIVASDEGDVVKLAHALRNAGIHTAIDDFGTGGSSLGRVRDVPVEILKIDRAFVARSEVDTKAKAVASTVVRLAAELGMIVVAEGVENAMQLQVMLETGCEYAQGYALGHPMPAGLFESTLIRIPVMDAGA